MTPSLPPPPPPYCTPALARLQVRALGAIREMATICQQRLAIGDSEVEPLACLDYFCARLTKDALRLCRDWLAHHGCFCVYPCRCRSAARGIHGHVLGVYLVCTCRASRSTTNREINCRLATHNDSYLSLTQCPVDLSVQASRAPLSKYLPSSSLHRMFIDSASPSCGDVALPRCKPTYIPLTNRFRVHERGSRVVSTTSVAL
jgi:hypothetical protein